MLKLITTTIIFKIALITFKALRGKVPQYIVDLLKLYNRARTPRSYSQNLFTNLD